ncbi:MAG TPA: CoA transferase [Gaiellaceae bacterium]|nr:CoA transferase [Gaiellaceae bacterium]
MSETLPRPLDGITVVDLTIALAGPYATQLLGALGATVIKVENPAGGDPSRNNAPYVGSAGLTLGREGDDAMSVSMLERGRNKLGVTLNLKHPEGRDVFADLVRTADVLVENFSSGTMDRLGIGYAWASSLNKRIVYTSISGFGAGQPGKGMDTIFQALSGLMRMSGSDGDPPVRSGVPFGDLTGPLFAVIGTLSALLLRERTGRGQHVDVSLLGSLTALAATEPWGTMERAGIEMRTGNTVPRLAPFGIFATRDGHVALCAPTDAFARGVFAALGRPELGDDERFATRDRRVRNARALHAEIEAWAAERETAAVIAALEESGVPAAVVRGPDDAVHDEQVLRRGETTPLEHPTLGVVDGLVGSGLPIRYSAARAGYDRPSPGLGEHNELVYCGLLGYDPARFHELRAAGVV